VNALLLALVLSTSPTVDGGTEIVTVNCEKKIRVELSQTSYTLNLWKHVRNAANAVEFDLPVACSFYEEVRVGDDLLTKKFRWGSLAVGGTFGNWNLKVVGK
jgi:hypothetical protein